MKHIINLVILLFLVIGCKKEIKPEKTQESITKQKGTIPEETTTNSKKDSIRVFDVYFKPETSKNKTEKISEITKKLQPKFTEYPFSNDLNELRDIKQGYHSKGFLKTLAKDFENTDFLDVASIHYSFLVPSQNKNTSYIALEEWDFNDIKKAKSCFESLKKYNEAEIHFKTINWIWVYQEHKIYLIFATDYVVTDTEMQNIKQELIKTVSRLRAYETVQFYE